MEFYKKLGAVNLTETELWQKMRLDKEALKKIINANITVNNQLKISNKYIICLKINMYLN